MSICLDSVHPNNIDNGADMESEITINFDDFKEAQINVPSHSLLGTPQTVSPNLLALVYDKDIAEIYKKIKTQNKYENKRLVDSSLEKVNQVFHESGICSIDRAINEITGLMSIRLRDEYRQMCSEMHMAISNILSSELSQCNSSYKDIIYKFENMSKLTKQYEAQIAKRDNVIGILKAEISLASENARKELQAEHFARKRFCSTFIFAYARQKLIRRVWMAWKRGLEGTWKIRTHSRFAKEAQEKCTQLTEDYEIKIAELRARLQEAEDKCATAERSQAQTCDTMRSALMRGVCALNMETMAALKLENGDDAAGADFKATAAFPIIEKAASSLRYGLIEESWPRVAHSNDEVLCHTGTPKAERDISAVVEYCGHRSANEQSPKRCTSLYEAPPSAPLPSRPIVATMGPVKVVSARQRVAESGVRCDVATELRKSASLFRAHVVQNGSPAGPSIYSSATLAAVRVERHGTEEKKPTPPHREGILRNSIRRTPFSQSATIRRQQKT